MATHGREPDDRSHQPPAWRRYLRFWGPRATEDFGEELEFHIAMRARDFEARGLSAADARQAAIDRLGDLDRVRTDSLEILHRQERRMTRSLLIDTVLQDFRFALRLLRRQPLWTTMAVLTLAIGIGASTAVFSVINSLLLHPLAYRDADRVVNAWMSDSSGSLRVSVNEAILAAWRTRAATIDGVTAYRTSKLTLVDRGDPTFVSTAYIDAGFLDFTGLPPTRGRGFVPDEVRGGLPVAMISARLWRTRFGSAPDIVGRTLRLGTQNFQIVGVTHDRLRLAQPTIPAPDVWLPLEPTPMGAQPLVRLKKGVDLATAAAELGALAKIAKPASGPLKRVLMMRPANQINFRGPLYLLGGAVVVLLLAACANVTHLLLSRASSRERELAIRAAIGAGRGRMLRQMVTESIVLTAGGSLLGIALSAAGVKALLSLRPEILTPLDLTRLDARAMWTAIVVSLLAATIFGVLSAAHARLNATADGLRMSSLAGGAGPRSHRLRSLMVVSEMAMSAALLVGATLVVRGVIQLQRVDRGFDAKQVYSIAPLLPAARYPTPASRVAFMQLVAERARGIDGVESAALGWGSPALPGGAMMADVEGENGNTFHGSGFVYQNGVDPRFFSVAGIRLIGQTFSPGSSQRRDVIINEGLARRLWPGQSPIGRRWRFRNGGGSDEIGPWNTVVGVAANVPIRGLAEDVSAPMVYIPISDERPPGTLIVRGQPGRDLTAALHGLVPMMDRGVVAPPVARGEELVLNSIASERFTMLLLSVFAATTVLLAGIGLFGVLSYAVAQRTREIGIRLALGATPAEVGRQTIVQGVLLCVSGLVIGQLLGFWVARLAGHSIVGLGDIDGAAAIVSGMMLLATALAACAVPVWRAMHTDPALAIRS